jgi:hypothetical protein
VSLSETTFGLVNEYSYAAQFNIDLVTLLIKAALSFQTVSDSTQLFAGLHH